MENKNYDVHWRGRHICEIEGTSVDDVYEKIMSDLIIEELREE